jgi:hypothetical protein
LSVAGSRNCCHGGGREEASPLLVVAVAAVVDAAAVVSVAAVVASPSSLQLTISGHVQIPPTPTPPLNSNPLGQVVSLVTTPDWQ